MVRKTNFKIIRQFKKDFFYFLQQGQYMLQFWIDGKMFGYKT